MLDQETLSRDLKNCINEVPVTVRHNSREFKVRLYATADMFQLMEGGIRDNMSIQVIAPRQEFRNIPPRSLDDFECLIDGKWIMFQIRDVPDFFDPMTPSYTINLQSRQKGIE